MDRRVVVTAASAITPIGRTKDEITDNLIRGVSGVAKLREPGFLTENIHSKVYGTVGYPIEYDFERRFRKTMAPVSFYACQVAKEVIAKAALEQNYLSSGRVGIAFGSIHGSPTVQQSVYKAAFDMAAGRDIGPFPISGADYLKSMVHTTAVSISKMFAITGRIISSCTACTTASQSIGFGYEAIRFGMQDAMLCGAADEYDTTTVAVFDNLLACSSAFNDTPTKTPRPFDLRRDGLVVGEGAGILLLEEYEHAKKRGAEMLGEVIGFHCGNNGGDLVLPDVEGVRRTIEGALASAGIGPRDVDFVSAHATATRQGDAVEAEAIRAVYGHQPFVTGFKGAVGHTMSACGALESIFTLYLMEKGVVVPTLNLDEIDPKCAMIRHPRQIEQVNVRIASVQNFAFGGVNTCLFFKKLD
jgi:3-oxoacyl-[acyl-carrier-protein] synthase II